MRSSELVWARASRNANSLASLPEFTKKQTRSGCGSVEELPLSTHRFPLGALDGGRYVLAEIPVAPGELVLGYSDGVLDARSPAGDFFGAERLAAALREAPADADQAVDSILSTLAAFTRGEEAYDDVTLVALARPSEISADA